MQPPEALPITPETLPLVNVAWRIRLLGHAQRMFRFALVGCTGVLVNTMILYLLVERGGWNHMLAAIVATEAAIISNFLLNDRWTFGGVRAGVPWAGRLWRYNVIALGGMLLSLGVLALLTLSLHMHYLLANLIGIAVATIWNYAVNSHFTWSLRTTSNAKRTPIETYAERVALEEA